MPVQHLTVTKAEHGLKLFQFLERRLAKAAPRNLIMKWTRSGQVRVDGGRAKPFDRLAEGQVVRVPPFTPDERTSGPAPPLPPLDILHQDDEIIVIAKPSGLAAQPGSKLTDSVQDRLAERFAEPGFTPNIVHRLDKDTSGLIVAGRTHQAVRRLSEAFAAREVRKTYLAWVSGGWPEDGPSLLDDRLAKVRRGANEKMEAGQGRRALAQVRPLRRAPGATLLEVELLTGRTHQIRVQLASRGHPILGDRKYGRRPHTTPLLLHAWRLTLPGYGAFECPPPWQGEWRVRGKSQV